MRYRHKSNHALLPYFSASAGWLGLLALLLTACNSQAPLGPASMPDPTPTVYEARMRQMGFTELVDDQLSPLPLTANPSQADLGHEPYRQICMACHGDWGQGLTDEWREEWGPDGNCWQSKCHDFDRLDWGFQLPRTVPAVLGPGSLNRHSTAADLQQNIIQTMPWWNPGSLNEQDSWALTAFLMRTRHEIGPEVVLTPDNALVYNLHVAYISPPDTTTGPLLLQLLLLLMFATLVRRKDGHAT